MYGMGAQDMCAGEMGCSAVIIDSRKLSVVDKILVCGYAVDSLLR